MAPIKTKSRRRKSRGLSATKTTTSTKDAHLAGVNTAIGRRVDNIGIEQAREKTRKEELAKLIFKRSKTRPTVKQKKNASSFAKLSEMSKPSLFSSATQPTRINTPGVPHSILREQQPPRSSAHHMFESNEMQHTYSRNSPPSYPAYMEGEFNIKGVSSSFTVIATNFAPGTTAADIETVVTAREHNITGLLSCTLLSEFPEVKAELVFDDIENAQKLVGLFNQKKADGRQLSVYIQEPYFYRPSSNRPRRDRMDPIDYDKPRDRSYIPSKNTRSPAQSWRYS